jgi:phosphoenolpyruvate carboxykinase (ATP)
MDIGRFNPQKSIESQGITGVRNTHYNLLEPALIQAALVRGEGELGQGGTLLVTTGKYSGRSPKDKFTVAEPSVKDSIWWENNPPMEPTVFEVLRKDMFAYLADRDVFVQDLYAGADPEFRINVRQIHELAWHNLFIRHMLRRPKVEELSDFVPEFTVVNCPGFAADPTKHGCRSSTVIAVSFEQRLVLIGGTGYGGENKKSIF